EEHHCLDSVVPTSRTIPVCMASSSCSPSRNEDREHQQADEPDEDHVLRGGDIDGAEHPGPGLRELNVAERRLDLTLIQHMVEYVELLGITRRGRNRTLDDGCRLYLLRRRQEREREKDAC